MADVQLLAVADVIEQRATELARKFGVPKVYPSDEALVQDPDVDVVILATPSGMHADAAVRAMRAGKHVIVEKPMDISLEACDRIIAAQKETGQLFTVISQHRFDSATRVVKDAIDSGKLGKIILADATVKWWRTQKYYDSGDWRGTWALDGGVLANQAPHMIDRLIWLAGEVVEVTDATALCGLERNIEAETVAVAKARLASGALATITGTTLAYNGLPQRVVICGTEGSAAFEGDTLTHFKTSRPFEEGETADGSSTPGGAANAMDIGTNLHTRNIRDFARAVLEGREPQATGIDGRRVVDALNKIYRAAKVGPFA